MENHICKNSLPKFHSIFKYKVENYEKRKNDLLRDSTKLNSLSPRNKTIWKSKYVTFNFDKEELNNFPSEKLENLKKTLYSIPGLGNEEDFIEYKYHYKYNINNNNIEQSNLISFENDIKENTPSNNIFDVASLSDINEYPFLNPSFYISPSIVSSVHISLLTSQIKVKYNPDFTNYLLIKNVILQSGLNILETITYPYINVTYNTIKNDKISSTTIENLSERDRKNYGDSFVNEFLNSSNEQDQEFLNISSIKYQNKYNKSALLELSCSGICYPNCNECIHWLKNCLSLYLFDQIDIQSIQFIQQPWIDFSDNKSSNNSDSNICRFSMIFKYHESIENFIFDDINNILYEMKIHIHRIQTEYLSLSNEEKIKRNSISSINDLEKTSNTKKISLYSISFTLPTLRRASEAMHLESKLLKIAGIKGPIKFDFINKQCTIIYNSYQISIKDIISEMKNYHFNASTITDSFHRLPKEEENLILSLPINNMNDNNGGFEYISFDKQNNKRMSSSTLIDQDEAEKTEICYVTDSEANLLSNTNYANSNSSSSSTEYMGNNSETSEISSHGIDTNYIELKNQIDKKSKIIMDKRFILYSKIERSFNICCILTIISFITPYLFIWINYMTKNSYASLNLHLECFIVFLLSLPVQFYFGREIHSKALHMILSNKCECCYSNDEMDKYNSRNDNKNEQITCPLNQSKNRNHRINRIVVLSLGTWIIWIYSTIGIFIRLLQMYTNNSKYESPHIYHEYYETSSLLITCYYVVKLLELSTKQYTINNISQFMHLQMKKAILLTPLDKALSNCNTINEKTLRTEWKESIVDVNSLKEGDIIKILPGNRIPFNGSIIYGQTKVDESMISGNTKSVTKTVMDRVISGTMNIESSIYVKILDASNDCTFYSMINFIEDVQLSKSSFHVFTDNIYKFLLPITLALSAITLTFWTFRKIDVDGQAINKETLKDNYQIEFGIIFAINILIIACPYTIEFAFPIAISIASKIGMKYGILIKDDALTFKKLNSLDIIVFNKDQVVTNGNPSIVEIIIDKNLSIFNSDKEESFFEILKSLERCSSSIYAKCIRNYLKKVEMSLPNKVLASSWNVLYYHETEGYNIIAKIRSASNPDSDILDICMGCEKWMTKQKCIPSMDQSRLSVWTERGYSIIYVAINKVIVGMLGIHDGVRDGTRSLIQCLKEQYHIEPWLLSYDNEASTVNTAKQIGIDEKNCLFNVLPSEKQEKIKWLQYNYIYNSSLKKNKSFKSDLRFANNRIDRELSDYTVYREEESNSNNFDPFNPHNSTNIFSNYNVIAPIPSMSRESLISESSSKTLLNSNDDVHIKIETEEKDKDDEQLISQRNDRNKNLVAYIGNDINDSDVLSAADVGLCLGILNDISLDSSLITTIYQDIQCINKLLHLTKYIVNYTYTTIIYIILLQILLLPVATGLLYPYTWLNPLWILVNFILNIIIHYYRAINLKKTNLI